MTRGEIDPGCRLGFPHDDHLDLCIELKLLTKTCEYVVVVNDLSEALLSVSDER